jgi:hypothetical protein
VLATGCGSDPIVDIRLTVYDLGTPVADARVWFIDPAGELVAQGRTDDDGVYGGPAPAGATVSAAFALPDADAESWQMYTIANAEVGDDLWVGDRRPNDLAEVGVVAVRLPGPVEEGWNYEVSIGCQQALTMDPDMPVALVVPAGCLTPGGQIVVRARAFVFGESRAVAFVPAQTYAAPSGGDPVAIDLPAWQTETASFTLGLSGIPADATAAHSQLSVFHDGVPFETFTIDTTEIAGGAVEDVFEYLPGVATRLLWSPSVRRPDGVQMVVRSSAVPPPEGDTADFSGDVLPLLTEVAGGIAADGSPQLSWQGAVVADGTAAATEWTTPEGTVARWTLMAPADGAATLDFPVLPDALANVRGAPGTAVLSSLFLMESDDIDGYRDFRSGAGQDLIDPPPPAGEFRARVTVHGLLAQ